MQTAAYNGNNLEFRYNADGIRTRKIVNGAYTYYSVNGNNVVWQRTPNGIDAFFDYDAAGRAATMAYNGSTYYYVYNMQGDVIGLVDRNGDKMVEYTYDPYGKQLTCTGTLASTIGQINPFRYRGYVYDAETGLYYLNSRYYDPETGRFLNADEFASTDDGLMSCNMYTYCLNNPIIFCDDSGRFVSFVFGIDICSVDVVGNEGAFCRSCVDTGNFKPLPTEAWLRGIAKAGKLIKSAETKLQPLDFSNQQAIRIPKIPAKRINFDHKKDAKEAAKKAGGGKEPIHHPNGDANNPKSHFHPNVPNPYSKTPHQANSHDHYQYVQVGYVISLTR